MLNLAAHSRLWIFQADRFMTETEVATINGSLKEFVQGWASHGNELYGDFKVENELFILVAADESKSPTSGCSIDALTRKIKELGEQLNIDFFNRLNIAYEEPSTEIKVISMLEFKNLMSSDTITRQTTVYNNLVETVADLDSNWRTTVGESWHKNLLQVL